MPDDLNKDVVGARINLDTTKIAESFKVIDSGAKSNLATFKELNVELSKTAKGYAQMASAADKLVLSSDERRRKIMAESEALVSQRTAQADLLRAKTQQLNQTNQLVDTKMQAQLALVKRRNAAIEQQEREHQIRMTTLQTRSANELSRLNGVGDYSVMNRSSQYMLAGTLFYTAIRGAREAISVLQDFERELVNVKRVMGQEADIELVKKSMISDAKEYGYALRDVGEVYTQIAQQGFDERQTAALARTALMAANVEESFRDAAQAQQLMTGAILNFNMAAEDSEHLLDMINQVSNDYATDSKKLLEGINRTGAAAKNAGTPIEKLIGYLTVLNQAGFSGSVAGNAIKSFISFSSRDIAIEKLEKYIGTIKQASGEMMPFAERIDKIAEIWYKVSDAERQEITQAVARGDQASRFIALMDNYSKVMDVVTTAENSFGSAQRENALAMTTLEKQSLQLKAAWDELIVSIGDSGLLGILKAIVHEEKLLVDGFNSLPEPMRNTLVVALSLGTAFVVLNTGARLFAGQSLVQMVKSLKNATTAMLGLKAATDATNVSQKAFIATPIGATLTALAAIIGIVTIAWSHYNGKQNEISETMSQNERDVYALANRYKELKSVVDDNTKSDKDITQAKSELATVIDKVSALMPNLVSQWDAHGKAIDLNIAKLDEWMTKYSSSMRLVEQNNIAELTKQKNQLEFDIGIAESRQMNYNDSDLSIWDMVTGKSAEDYRLENAKEVVKLATELEQVKESIRKSQEVLDLLDGKGTGTTGQNKNHGGKEKTEEDIEEEYKLRREEFQSRMAEFRHMVNVESDGYKSAKEQLAKLQAIRGEFGDLYAEDLYGIDEDIYKLKNGKKTKSSDDPLKDYFDSQKRLISHKKSMGRLTEEEELSAWEKLRSRLKAGTDMAMEADEKIYDSKKALRDKEKRLLEDSYKFSESWINHQKAIGKLSEQEEYESWLRVQARYMKGTELRKRADEEVYAAKQALLKKEESTLDDFVKKQQKAWEKSRKAELDSIKKAKDEFVKAQDEKIEAINRVLAAQDQANDDQDYEKSLAEKQARLIALQSGVGPESAKERADLTKEIARMQEERQRELDKRALVAAKEALENEKRQRLDDFDKQIDDVEEHYDNLLQAFDGFSKDAEGRAETLKQIQIAKESEKNDEILRQLDLFIAEYQRKMSSITSLSRDQQDIDWERYINNQAIYNNPNSTAAQKQNAHAENVTLRDKYGISQTNYAGLQHFKDGGVVQGSMGSAVPVVAHAGEMYLNPSQQFKLFDLIRFHMPSIDYSGPKSLTNIYYSFDNSIGDVELSGPNATAALFDQRTGLIERQRSLGGKVRGK